MASTPSYLPVYTLSTELAPTESDYLVIQSGADNGDVKLLGVDTFLDTFLREFMDGSGIDAETKATYAAMGWEDPS